MAALAADEVVLIPGSYKGSVERAGGLQASSEGLALKCEGPGEHRRMRHIEWAADQVEVVFPGELPIQFAGKGGVAGEAEVLLQINGGDVGTARHALEVAGRLRVVPGSVDAEFVVVEVFVLGGFLGERCG